LRYLKISQCRYRFTENEDEDDEVNDVNSWFGLPSGLYEVNYDLESNSSLFLAPSGDVKEDLVLSDQTSISPQLKELADQVAQMEVDKVAEIEREFWVRTDIVGFSKPIEPIKFDPSLFEEDFELEDEYVFSGDDHGNAPDGENGKTMAVNGEHQEKDDHEELENTV
jgi:hypothetical protein